MLTPNNPGTFRWNPVNKGSAGDNNIRRQYQLHKQAAVAAKKEIDQCRRSARVRQPRSESQMAQK
jgi:hypothetical protein